MTDPLPVVDVVVTVIHRGDQILLVFNPLWGAFTLPMTKLRRWPYGTAAKAGRVEDAADAAMRNVGECLGSSSTDEPRRWLGGEKLIELLQGDRDSMSKQYNVEVFGFAAPSSDLAPGVCGQWLPMDEILDERRRPISPTARFVIQHLQAQANLRGRAFPPQ
jgi:hypothetical protein